MSFTMSFMKHDDAKSKRSWIETRPAPPTSGGGIGLELRSITNLDTDPPEESISVE